MKDIKMTFHEFFKSLSDSSSHFGYITPVNISWYKIFVGTQIVSTTII
jgi:hypothetical protein